jgi:hypothetical protein
VSVLFLLGSHQPGWLARAGVALFVCDRRLAPYRRLPVAAAPWALDSGGFTELQKYGRWTVTPAEYAARVRRYRDECGRLLWAAPQDWMCEPIVINGGRAGRAVFAGTHLPVAEHQRRTVANYLRLRDLAPDLPWIEVVQGGTRDEYERCADLYEAAGIDLTAAPLVGVGSVCRRQGTAEVHRIIAALHARGITRLHGFGVKTLGLGRYGHLLTSADSLAWSEDARRLGHPMPGCPPHQPGCPARCRAHHANCANCLRYALHWRTTRALAAASRAAGTLPGSQIPLFTTPEVAA